MKNLEKWSGLGINIQVGTDCGTILIVEDSPVVRRLIRVCFAHTGVVLSEASDGPSGLATAIEEIPSLIILDIGLPGMNGWEVLDRLREDAMTARIPVLVLTAHAQEESRERASRHGADAFMAKPFEPRDLRETASRLLGTNLQTPVADLT